MDTLLNFSLPIVLFLLTLAFGFWLSKVGKPYNGTLFNIHKLIALGAVVLAVVQLLKVPIPAESPGFVIALHILAALFVIALFASGALMSAGKLDYAHMLTIHRIAPPGLVLSLGLAMLLLK